MSVLVLAWVATATAKGDYRLGPIPFGHSSAHRDATVSALLSSALTWVCAAVSCAPCLSA